MSSFDKNRLLPVDASHAVARMLKEHDGYLGIDSSSFLMYAYAKQNGLVDDRFSLTDEQEVRCDDVFRLGIMPGKRGVPLDSCLLVPARNLETCQMIGKTFIDTGRRLHKGKWCAYNPDSDEWDADPTENPYLVSTIECFSYDVKEEAARRGIPM